MQMSLMCNIIGANGIYHTCITSQTREEEYPVYVQGYSIPCYSFTVKRGCMYGAIQSHGTFKTGCVYTGFIKPHVTFKRDVCALGGGRG